MRITAPAKINLTLEVTGRRDDGYHTLRSVMVPIELADEVTIEASERFAFTCSDAALEGESNLVVRAARAVDPRTSVRIHLEKRVPSQAGLGGGSSDAASVLLAAMQGAIPAPEGVDWLATARSLGSDVPFFLCGSGALVEGTGERVTACGTLPDWRVLVVKPPAAVSTADAYRWIDEHPAPSRPRNSSVSLAALSALQRNDFDAVAALMQNDFHDVIAARVPEVARTVNALERAGARRPLLSGSGSAVFAMFPDQAAVDAAAARLDLPAEYRVYPTRLAGTPAWR